MKLAGLFAAAMLMAANPLQLGDTANRARFEAEDARNLQSLSHLATEPAPTPIVAGSTAPDFSYQTPDNKWHRLHELLEQGPVLLMVGGREDHLAALEGERDKLLDLGVLPVALLDASSRATRTTAHRLALHYTLIADPRSVIAGQFNALSPRTDAPMPCWFVIDRKGQVRDLDRSGLPRSGYTAIAIKALALPSPGISISTSTH